MRARLVILLLPLLTACQLSLPGKAKDAPAVNPITVGAIAVTSLDAPPAAPAPGTPVAVTPAAVTPARATPAAPKPAAAPAQTPAPVAEPVAEPAPEVPVPLSPEALACKAAGGTWGKVQGTVAYTCYQPTGDAGKSCQRQSDCETECLARSRTCAPITPLFGCNPVLQADGREVNLCID